MRRTTLGFACVFVLAVLWVPARAETRHSMRGMVLQVDAAHQSVVISHDAVPGVMPAMAMPFEVRTASELKGLVPGAIVSFTLVIRQSSSHIEHMQVVRYESVERDPIAARRLRLLQEVTRAPATPPALGQMAPDFSLTDQSRAPIVLSQLRGKVVALNFVYTSCVLPQFCYRLASQFAAVQKRFRAQMGRDVVLLTTTFDPARDTPERLAEYSRQWSADPASWHFLTGSVEDVERVCRLFGIDAFPDEGLITHSTRTVVIDRRGMLAASIEGNQFTATQLGDLIDAVLRR
ncbi:MAG TPA: SCO family protein [Vicinamibacterales bacterium]|nr:SCO family protein [Vicinamibacterales bacterium]